METLLVQITQEAVVFLEKCIVQASSIGGYLTFPGSSFYHAGKFALGGYLPKRWTPAGESNFWWLPRVASRPISAQMCSSRTVILLMIPQQACLAD
ncbi:hypothetical protein P170DRAFT_194898 [Aspergillus steynii IBT 23096]|uniref:Uncharacterized protein n=1 Tax=Aspergillus steynii IBT 23096 TaxID=1392250 RepID=A0A2I2G3X7_9EURO|nr:uncharacterized protein P170DRAFT_194898 [Aspergillus steynii IBT 23096]PLB47585.1 hypothetical protein P170DRAFT_194898 [Aspergillus steynii IBT 23096]